MPAEMLMLAWDSKYRNHQNPFELTQHQIFDLVTAANAIVTNRAALQSVRLHLLMASVQTAVNQRDWIYCAASAAAYWPAYPTAMTNLTNM